MKRNQFFDFLKGTTIILVVLGHCIQYGSGSEFAAGEMYYSNLLFKVIYSFHMPVFATISGYFTYYSLKKYL